MVNNSLQHHGVKGMKWGIRRFQNKDGSLTAAGKKRQSSMSDDAREVDTIRKKKVSEMSNAELRKLNDRTQLEQNYHRLNPSTVKKGMAIVATTAATMNTLLNLYNNSDKLVKTGKKVCEKMLKK